MIRHGYNNCGSCHTDPSGGGLLTEYGRAQSDLLLRTHYSNSADGDFQEPHPSYKFLAGAVELPEGLVLGGAYRGIWLRTKAAGREDSRYIPMQADLQGQVTVGKLVVNGSVGYAHEGALPAAVTHGDARNIVSRTHWVGYRLGEDENWLLRGGRMNLPFGVRGVEHTLWARRETRTDTNSAQQHGLAVAYQGEAIRAELMGIAGNFQVNPDRFRERGTSAFLEWIATPELAVGASSLLTAVEADVITSQKGWRGAHGAFARTKLLEPLVILGEVDLLLNKATDGPDTDLKFGHVAMLQVDVEPLQGIHLITTAETLNQGQGLGTSVGGWLSVAWFFMPHADLRLDFIEQSVATRGDPVAVRTILAQFHGSL
jgi:hypothetical protein